jgi:hypothetical protein
MVSPREESPRERGTPNRAAARTGVFGFVLAKTGESVLHLGDAAGRFRALFRMKSIIDCNFGPAEQVPRQPLENDRQKKMHPSGLRAQFDMTISPIVDLESSVKTKCSAGAVRSCAMLCDQAAVIVPTALLTWR